MPKQSPRRISMNLRIHGVWELLDSFEDECELRGWKTSEHEDWVTTDSEKYHNFLWIQTVHPTTFEKICADRKVAVRGDARAHFLVKAWKRRKPKVNPLEACHRLELSEAQKEIARRLEAVQEK